MMVAVIGLGSCADDDDTPQLTSTTTMVLNKLPMDSINQNNSNYTFSWSPARFYLDGNQEPTNIGSYENSGVLYTIQMDTVGGDFSNAQELASATVPNNYANVTYDEILGKVEALTGQNQDENEHVFDLQFRVKAQYSSPGADSISLYSNVIEEPFKMTIKTTPEAPAPRLFVCDEAGYGDLYLYAWADGGNVKDPWPGVAASGTVSFNGKTYSEFDLSKEYYSKPVNYIINNNNGKQMDLMQNYQLTEDTYVTINADGTYTVYEKPTPKIYVHSDLGWSDYYIYGWAGSGDIKDPWPGLHYGDKVTINGEDWYVFPLDKAYVGVNGNYIINNNSGSQYDILTGEDIENDVFVRIAADGSYTESAGPVQDGNNTFTIYANIDGSGWDALAFYVWGDAEQCGGWPGAVADGPLNINGKNYYYHTFTKGDAVNVILNNNGGGNQCPDITDQTAGVYTVTAGNQTVKEIGF